MGSIKKDKILLASLLLSLNFHLILWGVVALDFSEVNIKLSISSAISRLEEIMGQTKKTLGEKIKQVVDEMSLDLKAKGRELSKIKQKESPIKALDSLKKRQEELMGSGGPNKKDGGDGRGHIPGFAGFLPAPMEVELIEVPPIKKEEPKLDTTGPGEIVVTKLDTSKECDDKDSFGGVGIQFKNIKGKVGEHEVDILAPGQPAEKAGLKKGDVIKGDPLRFRGAKGSFVEIEYFRNGKAYKTTVMRSKICFKRETLKVQPKAQM